MTFERSLMYFLCVAGLTALLRQFLGKHMKTKIAWLDRVPGKALRLVRGQKSTAKEKKIKGMRVTVRICTLAEAKTNYVKYCGEVKMLRRDKHLVKQLIFETTAHTLRIC